MNQNIEVLKGKKVIKDTPGTYVSQTLQLTLTGDEQGVNEVVFGEVTNFANLYDLDIVQISSITGQFPHISVTVIFKKGRSYK